MKFIHDFESIVKSCQKAWQDMKKNFQIPLPRIKGGSLFIATGGLRNKIGIIELRRAEDDKPSRKFGVRPGAAPNGRSVPEMSAFVSQNGYCFLNDTRVVYVMSCPIHWFQPFVTRLNENLCLYKVES